MRCSIWFAEACLGHVSLNAVPRHCSDVERSRYAKGPHLRQLPGDSGGPWYLSGYAYGIHMCGKTDGSGDSCYSKLGNLPASVKLLTYQQ